MIRPSCDVLNSLETAHGTNPRSPTWLIGETGPFRRFEQCIPIGRGETFWDRVARDVLCWRVKTRSGFTVDDPRPATAGARYRGCSASRSASPSWLPKLSRPLREQRSPIARSQGIPFRARRRSSSTVTETTSFSPSDRSPPRPHNSHGAPCTPSSVAPASHKSSRRRALR